jgi:hypothetical protein
VERNANRKFNWFGEEMIQDIINNEEVGWWKYMR